MDRPEVLHNILGVKFMSRNDDLMVSLFAVFTCDGATCSVEWFFGFYLGQSWVLAF